MRQNSLIVPAGRPHGISGRSAIERLTASLLRLRRSQEEIIIARYIHSPLQCDESDWLWLLQEGAKQSTPSALPCGHTLTPGVGRCDIPGKMAAAMPRSLARRVLRAAALPRSAATFSTLCRLDVLVRLPRPGCGMRVPFSRLSTGRTDGESSPKRPDN